MKVVGSQHPQIDSGFISSFVMFLKQSALNATQDYQEGFNIP